MSFFKKSSGEMSKGESAEITGSTDPIKDKTVATSMIEEAGWKEYNGDRYINLKWKVIDGPFKNRVAFQKLKVYDGKDSVADNAKEALYRLFLLCGAKPKDQEPTDMDLMKALCNKPLAPRFRVWEIDGKTGNYVDAIYKSVGESAATASATQESKEESFDDDIAF